MPKIRHMTILDYYRIQRIEIRKHTTEKILNTLLKTSMYVQP